MKRMTIQLPDELAVAVDQERRRQETSASAVVREALGSYLTTRNQGAFSDIFDLGETDSPISLSDHVEEILDAEYADEIERSSGLKPWEEPRENVGTQSASERGEHTAA